MIDWREVTEALRHVITGIVLASGIVGAIIVCAIASGALTIR
jgi:hypothetical protein